MNDKIEKEVITLKPFRRFCMTIGELPTSYLESMTYYEMLVWFTKYMQDTVIPTINNNGEAVSELQNLFVELQTYVNDYFDNLDVQEEINNKLDDMVEQGTLQEIIADYLNSKAVFGFDNVASMKSSTNLIDGSFAQTLGYHEKNDGGKALYKIREITNDDVVDEMKIIALSTNNLIAELIENNIINIKQIGGYGDDTNDDTAVIQYAVDNFDNIYIPEGTFKITDEIDIKPNITIKGNGSKSIIKSYFSYVDTIKYSFISDSEDTSITRTIIENIQFVSNNVNSLSGGIYIEFSTRGLVLNNLWFSDISNPIKLGNKIWGIASINNIFANFLPTNISAELQELSVGLTTKSNCIYASNVEFIGSFYYGINLNTAKVGSFKDTNISGSTSSYEMVNGIYLENCKNINLETSWIEHITGGVNGKAINIVGCDNIKIDNMYIPSGSLYVDDSVSIDINNTQYFTNSAGLRWLNNSSITCDKSSLGYCNYQANPIYSSGKVNVIDVENESNINLNNNPLLFDGILASLVVDNSNLVTRTPDTTHQKTGDKCFNFNTATNHGCKLDTSSFLEVGKKYTFLAYVKPYNNISNIRFANSGMTSITTFPNTVFTGNSEDYQLIKASYVVSNESNNIQILASLTDTSVNGDFIVDSLFIVEGLHNYDIPSAVNKKGLLNNSKLFNSSYPSAGVWSKGSKVYNNFSNPSNDNVECWIYDGTNWVAREISIN